MRRCTQIKCGFYLQGGCRPCNNCKSKPYEINESCRICVKCESEEGELRFGDEGQNTEGNEQIMIVGEVR